MKGRQIKSNLAFSGTLGFCDVGNELLSGNLGPYTSRRVGGTGTGQVAWWRDGRRPPVAGSCPPGAVGREGWKGRAVGSCTACTLTSRARRRVSLHCHPDGCHPFSPQKPCLALNSLSRFHPCLKVLLLRPINAELRPESHMGMLRFSGWGGVRGHPSTPLSQAQPGLATREGC